jgi:hypothetical protein
LTPLCPRNDWAPYLEAATQEEQWLARIREATQSGKPIGSPLFVSELERQAGQRLELRLRGRPRKHLAASAAGG